MKSTVTIRPLRPEELRVVARLFHETVHRVNCGDYTPDQVDAWAPAVLDLARWRQRLGGEEVVVAERAGEIVGFCSWDAGGYLDFLYVHHAHQRRGIATRLYAAAELSARAKGLGRIHAQVSLTAQPFFLRQGFRVVKHQVVRVSGVDLPNALMEKRLM